MLRGPDGGCTTLWASGIGEPPGQLLTNSDGSPTQPEWESQWWGPGSSPAPCWPHCALRAESWAPLGLETGSREASALAAIVSPPGRKG